MNIEEVKEDQLTPPPAAVQAAVKAAQDAQAQPTSQPASPQAQQAPQAEKNETQQMLDKLEKAYGEALQACAQADEEHEKLLARRHEAEKKKSQALTSLSSFKEQLLINAVNNLQQQLAQQKKQ